MRKTEPLKFKLSASYCINLAALNALNSLMICKNTRSCTQFYHVIINFSCILDLVFLPIINSKHSELSN